MRFPVLLYVQLTLSQERGFVHLERLYSFMSGVTSLWSGSSPLMSGALPFGAALTFFINSVSNFLNDFPHSISKTTSSNQNIHSSHPLQLFSKAKKIPLSNRYGERVRQYDSSSVCCKEVSSDAY